MRYKFITIEGNIGAGKTSLARKLSSDFKARLMLEQFADNPFLPKFYKDPARHAFPLELYFMAERFQQLRELQTEGDLFADVTITDYIFYKSLIFASNNLSPDESKLFQRLFHIINPTLPQPDIVLYLHKDTDVLLQNIQKRGRYYEKTIPGDYLDSIHHNYMSFFKNQAATRILIVESSHIDFIKSEEDYRKIIGLLETEFDKGVHYIVDL